MQKFENFNLDPTIMKAIDELGFQTPSPIQAETLPILLDENTDFIGLAATGTGKTAAFSIPLLQKINPQLKSVQALVLCPTRELALQVTGQINLLGKHRHIKAVPIYGGASYGDQIYGLKSGSQVVVGTPGRVVDHLSQGTLNLGNLKTFILDEADEMISMGFKEDLETILESANPDESNIWLFSATMSKGVRSVADQYLLKPKHVQTNRQEMLSSTVDQVYFLTREENKQEVLCKLIDNAKDFYGIIFGQTKDLVSDLTLYLNSHGYRADSLHGDKNQAAREKTMRAFRERKVKILVCTDVAARGIDVKDVTHVINYSIPRELDNYVHRIGRTARSGKSGVAMSLVTPSTRHLIKKVEQLTNSKLREGKIPTKREVGAKKISEYLDKFMAQKDFQKVMEVMDESWKKTLSEMSSEEVAGRFLNYLHPQLFKNMHEEREERFDRVDREEREERSERPKRRRKNRSSFQERNRNRQKNGRRARY